MRYQRVLLVFSIITLCLSCKPDQKDRHIKSPHPTELSPKGTPLPFKPELTPKDKLIHKGIIAPDFSAYYYTLSNTNFTQFDIHVIRRSKGDWSHPQKAVFNSEYDDHGMSFSPDGNTIYFSSTRPTSQELEPQTWNIWKLERINRNWTPPQIIKIPNLKGKLVSHPSVTGTGDLYFHSSNPDYSEMHLYKSKLVNNEYGNAEKVDFKDYQETGECTPYISPKEDYLLFASISNGLTLMISMNDGNGGWNKPKEFSPLINANNQGNPHVTLDHQSLFYTTGNHTTQDWQVKTVTFDLEDI